MLPGFIDAHCHLLAYAASLLSVDCSPAAVSSIADIQAAIRRRAESTPAGRWIRAVGYSEVDLAEGRHPTRWDLDAAAPDHPVRLIHRSGHACVLNSLALRLCGIDMATEEPAGGYLERDASSGEPSGLLLEMNELVERAVPPLAYEELAEGVRLASQRFLAAGVTSLVDASHTNGPAEWELMRRLRQEGHLAPRLTAMVGIEHLEDGRRWREAGGDGSISWGRPRSSSRSWARRSIPRRRRWRLWWPRPMTRAGRSPSTPWRSGRWPPPSPPTRRRWPAVPAAIIAIASSTAGSARRSSRGG